MEGADHRPRTGHPVLLPRLSGGAQLDLLGTDASPRSRARWRRAQAPFKFAVFRRLGQDARRGQPSPSERDLPRSPRAGPALRSRSATTRTRSGSQKSYGDLYQTGDNTSAVFGPNYWTVAGASLPLFPATGNHDHNNTVMLNELAAGCGRVQHPGAATRRTPTAARTAPPRWITRALGTRSSRAGALLRAGDRMGRQQHRAPPTPFQNDFDNHLGAELSAVPVARERPRDTPRALRFAFFHYPLYSDSQRERSDPLLARRRARSRGC